MADSPLWLTGAIASLMDGAKDAVVSSTKDAASTSKKGDSPNTISEPPKVSLQPMSEIASATGGSGSYLQAAATTAETIKTILASHKETIEKTKPHLHDHEHEAPDDMLGEVEMMLKALCDSMKASKKHHDKPNGLRFVSDSHALFEAPLTRIQGDNVSMGGAHSQIAFNSQSNTSKCAHSWHELSTENVKFVHHNYEIRNTLVGTDSKSGISNRTYFNEVSTDAAYKVSTTTKLHTIQASDIEEKGTNITSRAIETQTLASGTGITFTAGQGTAKGEAPSFFMAGIGASLGASLGQKIIGIGLSKIGGGSGLLGALGGLVGNPTPGTVYTLKPDGTNLVSPASTTLVGSKTTNVTGMARMVVHGEAINIANKLLADVSKGIKLEGVAGGVLTMLTKKFSLSMTGWMGEIINKVISEVVGCMEFPELPKLPTIALPRVPQINCMPPTDAPLNTSSMKKPPKAGGREGSDDAHSEGVHTEKYPIWLEDALNIVGISGKVAVDQVGVNGNDGDKKQTSSTALTATFGAALMVYKTRALELKGLPKPTSTVSASNERSEPGSTGPISKGATTGEGWVDAALKAGGASKDVIATLADYASGNISKAEATSLGFAKGIALTQYMDSSNLPSTKAEQLGVGGIANTSAPSSLVDVIALISGGKSMAVGDVLESVLGQIPGVKGETISLQQAMQDLGLGKAVGKDGTLESAELLGIAMDKVGLKLPEGMLTVKGDVVSIDVDKSLDKALDKAASFLGDLDPIKKVDRLLKVIGMGTPLTNLLNDLVACAKSWINVKAILKLPDIALDSITGKIGKIVLPGLDLDFLKDWSLCGKGKKGPILWDGVEQGQGGYKGTLSDGATTA